MSTPSQQPPKSPESAKGSRKRRRKGEIEPGKMLRDFLQRTGLNDDIEEFVAHVARQGISNLWQAFTPIAPEEATFQLPPKEPDKTRHSENPDDPYVIMGIHRNTPPEIMKAVYKAWAVNHHPDKGGDSETFKRINVAWDQIKEERGF